VTISRNTFRGHLNAAILFANAGQVQSNIDIRGNSSLNDATFVSLFAADNVRIEGNRIRDTMTADNADQGSKIFVGGDSNNVFIRGNWIDGGGYDGIAVRDTLGTEGGTSGVRIQGNFITNVDRDGISVTATASGAAQIVGNFITNVGQNGILLSGASGNEVSFNTVVSSGQDGISLVDADNNRLMGNISFRNAGDGIRVDADSTDNSISRNILLRNLGLDFEDLSTGNGTGGTANTWFRNVFRTSNLTAQV
jgi:parallel beta-helix repeat protein